MRPTSRLRTLVLLATGAAFMALVLTLVSNPHALPAPTKKPWKEWSLTQKRDYVTANLHHAKQAIRWIKAHRHMYGPAEKSMSSEHEFSARRLITQHRALRTKASRNLRAIEARLHPPFRYPWWWVPLGVCETGVNPPDPAYGAPGHPGGDGYHGWINFLPSTWLEYGGGQFAQYAYDATEYEQYIVTMRMHADVSWAQSNPACSARLGM